MSDGYSLRYTVPHKVTPLSPTRAIMEATGPPEAVWVPDPRPAPPELAEGFEPERYGTQAPLHAGEHIRDWASFSELVGHDGLKLLMARASIGEPDVRA